MPKNIEQINNTIFRQLVNDDWIDFLEVEIGDAKQVGFYPQIKIKRWDSEVNCSIRLKIDEKNHKIKEEYGKIKWQGDKIEVHFYNLTESEGGYEFEVILIDSDNITTEDTDFILTTNIPDLTNYKNVDGVMVCRVYQLNLL